MYSTIGAFGRRLRLGVIGGGAKSFIGPVHRAAARMDDNYEVVASMLSSNPERARAEGTAIGIAPDRAYGSAEEMFAKERARTDGMDVVAIMSPNDSHYRYCVAAIDAGYDVICDKPLATNLGDALDLAKRVQAAGIVFCQTFNYTGYPLVRQAMAMVRDGDIGEVRMVEAEYVQGYNYALTEGEKSGERNWHFVPEKAGQSLVLGDIGSHAHHLVRYVTGLNFARLVADVATTVPGRAPPSHDYAGVLFRLDNNAPGTMWVTQAGAGAVHGLYIRVFGEKGGLEWVQETPNQLFHSRPEAPALVYERGGPGLKPEARRAERIAIGHPEGYQEAFAVLYADAAEAIVARRLGKKPNRLALDFPNVVDGAHTMKFIEAAVESSRTGTWADCRLAI
ncbi:MAG TPA: Gfo/Idh/MocA family oxidoreductase [Bauldia sp.]|nr:Gfo/Idh/MocA family oxidoreductase [Bauldia sp.]